MNSSIMTTFNSVYSSKERRASMMYVEYINWNSLKFKARKFYQYSSCCSRWLEVASWFIVIRSNERKIRICIVWYSYNSPRVVETGSRFACKPLHQMIGWVLHLHQVPSLLQCLVFGSPLATRCWLEWTKTPVVQTITRDSYRELKLIIIIKIHILLVKNEATMQPWSIHFPYFSI